MVLSMQRWCGKVAIVTGASAGIGAAIAEHLVSAGLKVVGLARRKDKLEELAHKLSSKPGKLYACPTDISKEEDILKAFKWVKENVGPVSILINNAGVAKRTTLMAGPTDLWAEALDINVLALCIATRKAIKSMRENNIGGHIVHINSIAGHMVPPVPDLNIYSATKHAVTALTETLRQELNAIGSKIKISSICPGFVGTDLARASGAEFYEKTKLLEPEDIADGVIYVLSTPPHVQVHNLTIKPVGEAF